MFRTVEDCARPPCGNDLLASLFAPTLASLRPHLTRTRVEQGAIVDGGPIGADLVHFPETAVFCLRAGIPGGKRQGFGLVGREGALNWGLVAGHAVAGGQEAVAISAGTTLAIDGRLLRDACTLDPSLTMRLVGFAYQFACQLGATLRSSLCDAIDVRLSRWLLLWHDRIDDGEIMLTHELLAGMLGVRRATVTDALHILEGERLITCTRGRIVVRSRSLLEAYAGIAYGSADRVGSMLAGRVGTT
jgi:CRP-like cAMP-binding protein